MKLKDRLFKLLDLKSIITLIMTIVLAFMMFYPKEINDSILALFCTTYGSIITFFFTRKDIGGDK